MFLLEKSPAYQIISARYPETIRACRLLREKIQEGSNPTKRCDRTHMIPTAQGARNVRASLYSKVQTREVVPVILSPPTHPANLRGDVHRVTVPALLKKLLQVRAP